MKAQLFVVLLRVDAEGLTIGKVLVESGGVEVLLADIVLTISLAPLDLHLEGAHQSSQRASSTF